MSLSEFGQYLYAVTLWTDSGDGPTKFTEEVYGDNLVQVDDWVLSNMPGCAIILIENLTELERFSTV